MPTKEPPLQIDSRQIELVRLIATGTTLVSASRAMGITATRGAQVLLAACRKLGLPDGVKAIQADPQAYLAKLPQQTAPHAPGLRSTLERDLVQLFKLPPGAAITPQLLAKYSASQLSAAGLSTTAIAQINGWLQLHGQQFKRGPLSKADLKALATAVELLQAFHFDVTAARAQLQGELADAG